MPDNHSSLVKDHFESKYKNYDQLIRKLIPKYEEMHMKVIENVGNLSKKSSQILDLGIGTGKTALELLSKFQNAKVDGFDISPKMIQLGKDRLADHIAKVTFTEQDIKNLDLGDTSYDACVAVLSIHHLDANQKQELFKKLHSNLKTGGTLVVGDIVKFNSEEETRDKEKEWRNFLYQNLGEKEGQYWFDNYKEEDLPDSVTNQLSWLQRAGFSETGIAWEYMNYAVFFGKK